MTNRLRSGCCMEIVPISRFRERLSCTEIEVFNVRHTVSTSSCARTSGRTSWRGRKGADSGRTAAISHVQSRTPAGQGLHWLSGVGWWPAVRCVNTKLDKGSVFSHRSYLVMSGQGPAQATGLLRLCKARRAGAIRRSQGA